MANAWESIKTCRTNLDRVIYYQSRGFSLTGDTVFTDGEAEIIKAHISDWCGHRVPNTTVFCVYMDDYDEGTDFNTLKEAKAFLKEMKGE